MKSTALLVLVALFMNSDFGVNAIDTKNVQSLETLTDHKKEKKTKKSPAKSKKQKVTKKEEKPAKAEAKKEEKPAKAAEKKVEKKEEEEPAEDEEFTAVTSFNGADEDEVIDNQFNKIAKESMNAAGVSTGEKVVFKEDAIIAGKKIIKTLKGLKGKNLDDYLKDHFEETWANFDVNGDGSLSVEESHVFQRALMGRLNTFALAPGSVSDINSTPLTSLIEDANTNGEPDAPVPEPTE